MNTFFVRVKVLIGMTEKTPPQSAIIPRGVGHLQIKPRPISVANCDYEDEKTFINNHRMCIIKSFSRIDGRRICTQCFHKNFLDEYEDRIYESSHGKIIVSEEYKLRDKLICANCKQRLYLLLEENNCERCNRWMD